MLQDQAIQTNYIKTMVDKSQKDLKCRICKQSNETISHIVTSRSKLVKKEDKIRHDNTARVIHWDLSGKSGFERNERWYDHVPESVLEMMTGNFNNIGSRSPGLVIIDQRDKSYQILDVALSNDGRVRGTEDKKVKKYQDLVREVAKIWDRRSKAIPVVVGALTPIPLRLKDNLRTIEGRGEHSC